MVEMDANLKLIGPNMRRVYVVHDADRGSYPTSVLATSLLRSSLRAPYDEGIRYRDFMGWDIPWYSPPRALSTRFLSGAKSDCSTLCAT